jgi:general secretion pathway protein D
MRPLLAAWFVIGMAPSAPAQGVRTLESLAAKETQRRTALANQAMNDIQSGYDLLGEGKFEEALKVFEDSYQALPVTPLTQEARLAAQNGQVLAGIGHARTLQTEGKGKEAGALLESLLTVSPKDARVVAVQKLFSDPDRWPPALTPEHIANVKNVEELLVKANSFRELGDYDRAIATYQSALRIDPYNSTARRGMEASELDRQRYFKSAYDQQRAKMLGEVAKTWEDPVPLSDQDVSMLFGANAKSREYTASGREAITEKLRTLIFPRVEFSGATLDEVVELLRVRSKDVDPGGSGISFVINVPAEARNKPVSLDLFNVPVEEVIRYVSEMSGVAYKVDDNAVIFVSLSERESSMIARSFQVPPDFIQSAPVNDSGAAPADPFGQQAPAGGALTIRRMTAREFLEGQGVTFPDGTSAFFNKATSTLTVRNTLQNMELVELLVERASKAAPKMAVVQVRMIEVNQTNLDELGFDWLLGGVGTNGNNLFFGGGATGSGAPLVNANFPFSTDATIPAVTDNLGNTFVPARPLAFPLAAPFPQGITPLPVNGGGAGPVTSGLRSGTFATGASSLDSLLQTGSANGVQTAAPGVFSIAGVFTDPQFQTVIRALAQKRGIDVNASPSVTTKNGLKATVEVIREFIYPTEFDPPQLPQGGGGGGLLGGGGGGGGPQIATPTTPTAFEMRKTGVVMEVEPIISDDGRTVELTIAPELTEFEGFVNYGTPIIAPASSGLVSTSVGFLNFATSAQMITPNFILQPVFKTQKVATAVKIWDGATVVLGGAKIQRRTEVNDQVPMLGNLPFVGRFFQTHTTQTETKNIIIFVTVNVVDPSGKKVNQDTAAIARQ